jgi:nitrate/TMAO reductase-like tetraheme cytochrome c subunit
MTDEKRTRARRLVDRLGRLSPAALALVGIVVIASVGGVGYYAFRTYDYIEHDNEFCFSCHLMQEPFELFAQSAHRGLGCKACHQPNMLQRSQMGLTAVIENPDSIAVHAQVPNDLCADCHVNGDPERWTLVAASAGHRVHLESDDPALDGLQCVECHQSSLHQFTAVDETCAQSGCHTESGIQLGAMSDLTIHCAACHGFNAPAVDEADAALAMRPDEDTCLSCHAMRQLVEMPEPDPHEAACGACHDPHQQATPEEAAQSCATGACHSDPEELTPFHRGLDEGVIADCLYCHQAHDFDVDGQNCTACHTNVMEDEPGAVRQSMAGAIHGARFSVRMLHATPEAGARPPARVDALPRSGFGSMEAGAALLHSWGYPISQALDFRHSDHQAVTCTQCHQSTERHGAVSVTTVTDCRSCHHTEPTVSAAGCAACHAESGATGDPYAQTRTMSFSTGSTVERSLPFDHAMHVSQECASCHTEGLELSAAAVDCTSCHEEHHNPLADCMSCHAEPPDDAHTVDVAHMTCTGAGCHEPTPFEGLPRTRPFCLSCHQDMVDHRPGGDCAECHALAEVGR